MIRNVLLRKRFCSIIGDFISRKHGQKCCVYGQNGKPLSKEIVKRYLENFQKSAENELLSSNQSNQSELLQERKLINWKANEDYTRLFRVFYIKNVFFLCDFIRDLYELDLSQNIMQIPDISVRNQDLFKIELYSPKLKGLSYKDLQLASAINSMDFSKYLLVPIDNEEYYRQEIRKLTLDEQSKNILNELKNTQRTTLSNKYDALEYEKNKEK